MSSPSDSARRDLASKISDALRLADDLGLGGVAICLNEALVQLTGSGVSPPGY